MAGRITNSNFGKLPDRTAVEQYTLTNSKSALCKIITYGGIVTELHAPDKDGKPGIDGSTGDPTVYRKFSGGDEGQSRARLLTARGILPGDAAFSGFDEPCEFSVHCPVPWRRVSDFDDPPINSRLTM